MKYIYDILLNFTNDYYYDFYDWDSKDNIINIKKVPLIRVDRKIIEDFIFYKIRVDRLFIKTIDKKSIFLRKDKLNNYCPVILSNGEKSIGISFDDKGFIKYKSCMLLDEEEQTNRMVLNQKKIKIKYKKYNKNYINTIRCDTNKKAIILKKIKQEYNSKEYSKLRYIYYEIYDDNNKDINYIYNRLIKEVDDNLNTYIFLFNELITK